MSEVFNQLEDALKRKRKENYGSAWEAVDFWGIPLRDLPEEHREDILKWIRSGDQWKSHMEKMRAA